MHPPVLHRHTPTHKSTHNCAACCVLWPRSSHATSNPFLCCSLLVACKRFCISSAKRAFHCITQDYCCSSLHMLLPNSDVISAPCLHGTGKISNARLIIGIFPLLVCGLHGEVQQSAQPVCKIRRAGCHLLLPN